MRRVVKDEGYYFVLLKKIFNEVAFYFIRDFTSSVDSVLF